MKDFIQTKFIIKKGKEKEKRKKEIKRASNGREKMIEAHDSALFFLHPVHLLYIFDGLP